jgi:cation transport regulator ChaC
VKMPAKKSDLNPPLGYPGGPCQVIQRIRSTVRNPKVRDELVDDVEGYKGLSNPDAAKVYKLEVEKGGKAKFMQRVRISPHAQYRMDQRGITVPDVRVALQLFAREFYDSKSRDGAFYRSRSEDMARGEKILWVAKKIGRLAIVFVSEGQGTVTLVTTYWDGLSDPKPVDESVCRVAERYALRQEPSPGVQTYVTDKSQLDLPNNKDNSDKEPPSAAPLPGSATPGGAGRDIGTFEYSTPGPNSDIKPRTLGTPGAERGHPTNFITPGTMTRRTMTGDEEGHTKEGYKRRWKPGVRQRKTKGLAKHKRKMYYRKNRHKIRARQKVWRQKNKNNPLHKYNRKHRRKNPNQHRRRYGSPAVVAALFEVRAYSTGSRGGPQPTRQKRQQPEVRREQSRQYMQTRPKHIRRSLKRYHTFCKRNRQCLRQRQLYRTNPKRYKRRPPGNKEAALLVTPEIGFSIGQDMLLGYVHGISPMTGLVTFSVDSPNVNQLDSIPLDVFLRVVIFLEDADAEAFFELVDAEVGLEAYDDIDVDTVRYCAQLYGKNPDSADFRSQCMDLTGQEELSALTADELEEVNDKLVLDIMEGHLVRQDLDGDEGEVEEDDVYDLQMIYGEVPLEDRAAPAKVAERYAGAIILYDQENPANNEIKQPGADVNYRADSPTTYEKKPDEREGVPAGADMPSNQTENVPPASSRVIPDQMKDTLRDQLTYVQAARRRRPGVSKWTAANKIYDQVRDIEYGSAKVVRQMGTEWLITYRTTNGEARKVLVGGHESGPGQVYLSVRKYASKTACVVAVTEIEGETAMLKVRDRNYVPRIKVIREMQNGTEIAHLFDTWTGWSEGVNEYGIGVVSSALMVVQDEGEKKEPTGRSRNGKRIRQILGATDMDEAIEYAMSALVSGCTFISDGKRSVLVEYEPKTSDAPVLKTLKNGKNTVRTNHGVFLSGAGYTSGEDLKSSKTRKRTTEKALKDVTSIDDLAPAIARTRAKDRAHPFNPVRATDNMSTSTQIVTLPAQKELRIYLIPDEVDFVGVDNQLPKGRKPRVSVEIFEYEDWDSEDPKAVAAKGNQEVFRLFTYGSMMNKPSYSKDVIRSYKAVLKGHHRAYNRTSQNRDGIDVIGTEPGGKMEGVVHEYPVAVGHRILGQVDRREGFRTERDEDANSYLRQPINVKTPEGPARTIVYLSNPDGPNYHKPLKPAQAAKAIVGVPKAEKYLRGISKAVEEHGIKSPYITKVQSQVGKRKAVKTALFPVELPDNNAPKSPVYDSEYDTCSELPNGQEKQEGQDKTAAANVEEILSNCGLQLKGRAQDVSYARKRLSPSGMSTWVASGSRGETYTIKIKPIRKDKRIKAFAKLPIQVSCTCPYFRWQGPEHWAKKHGFLYGKQVGTASTPNIKDPEGKHWACKHVIAVLNLARKWRYAGDQEWSYEGDIVPMPSASRVAHRYSDG